MSDPNRNEHMKDSGYRGARHEATPSTRRAEPKNDQPRRAQPRRVAPGSARGAAPLAGPIASQPPISGRPETRSPSALAERAIEDESTSPTGLARDSDSSILRTSGSIALATLISRVTGFVRTVLILALLGASVASAFQAADVLPNMIAEVLLGAVLTAIVIPLLARAEAEDDDDGASFMNKIFTLTVVVLGIGTVVAIAIAPLLTSLNIDNGALRPLATGLAYFLLVEILFYGLTALFIAILNLRGYFKPGAWAPVLNNVIQIGALVTYSLMPGELTLNPVRMSDPQLLVVGIGCALGVVMQAVVLLPFLRRAGVRLRFEWGLDARLRKFGNMALAVVCYVAVLQVGLVITYRIASAASESGISVYFTHWQLLQLPYGVLGVTILTAIMPRLSRNAAADDTRAVVSDLSIATRLSMVALVPVVAFMTFFGPALAIAIFNFGRFDADSAGQLGSVLSWGAFTLIPYAMTLVQLRVFYAREDAWTPTLMVLGITAVKVAASYLGPVLFDNPDLVVRWLALSNGLGYLAGAIVGHYLLRSRLGYRRLAQATRTTALSIVVSVGVAALVWAVANLSGLHHLINRAGKFGSLFYLAFTAVVTLGVIYALLAALKIPDVVAIGNSVRRLLGRFIPALAPPPNRQPENAATITVAFPRVTDDESLPYSGQVQVLRRFDRGTATWQSYSVHSGGAAGYRPAPRLHPVPHPAAPPRDMRYRRKGVRRVSDSEVDTTAADQVSADPGSGSTTPPTSIPSSDSSRSAPRADAPESDAPRPAAPRRPRGPRLVPGAAVAGGRYRLLDHHGGARGLQFWRAQDVNLDRNVALTFVDAEQLAPPPERGVPVKASDQGPQAVLSRTLRLGQVSSDGVARVLDVVRGSSGGIVVAEWVEGSSLADVAQSGPSPIGAARAVRSLAAAAEIAHRSGGALSIDHPDRIRISHEGNAVLAFPGTLAGDDKESDVRGLGAVLYALLLNRWPLDAATGSKLSTTDEASDRVGGLAVAQPSADHKPIEPREANSDIPFEISAVAARALDGSRGIRTAATVQHVLDQATVLDLNTDMLPAIGDDDAPVSVARPSDPDENPRKRRNVGLLVGAGLLALFLIIALIVWATNVFGGDDGSADINSILTTSASAPPPPAAGARTGGPIALQSVTVKDFSNQPADSSANVANVISGAAPAWTTESYIRNPKFGGLKPGLGLMFDLGGQKAVKTVTIRTSTPGFRVSLRTSPSANPTFTQTTEVSAGVVNRPSSTLTIATPQDSPYLMVWITSLPSHGHGRYQAEVAQVSMTS